MRLQGLNAQSFPPEALRTMRDRFAAGHGTCPLVGDPDTIVKEMEKIPGSGFAGTTLSFVDYVTELPYFRDEVLPRLERMGVRNKFKARPRTTASFTGGVFLPQRGRYYRAARTSRRTSIGRCELFSTAFAFGRQSRSRYRKLTPSKSERDETK